MYIFKKKHGLISSLHCVTTPGGSLFDVLALLVFFLAAHALVCVPVCVWPGSMVLFYTWLMHGSCYVIYYISLFFPVFSVH